MAKRNPEIAQSLAHASQQTGIPVSMLKQARGAGCPAFRGCRVDLAVLREWLDENPDIYTAGGQESETMEAKKLELIKQQILRQREAVRGAKMENDIKAGLLVEVSEVVRDIVVLVSDLRAHFRRIEDGLPLALAGLSIAEQRMVIRKHFDDMSATIEKSDFSKRAEQK